MDKRLRKECFFGIAKTHTPTDTQAEYGNKLQRKILNNPQMDNNTQQIGGY